MPNLKINIFSGGNAFSSATAAKLTDEFNFSNNSKATIECIEVFLVSALTKKTSIHSIVALELFEKLNSSVSLAAVAEEKAFPPEKILIFKFGTY